MANGSTFHFPIADVTQNGAGHGNDDEAVCGIVMAGGEGKRLQPFITSLGKGTLPTQYVNFIGSCSMLEHTLRRAEKLMRSAHVLTVIRSTAKKIASEYPFVGRLPFDGDFRSREVAAKVSIHPRETYK